MYFAVVFIVRFESFSSPRSVCKALLSFALTIPSNEYTTTNTNGSSSSSNKYPIDASTSSKAYITQVNYLLYIVLIISLFINVTKYMLYSTLSCVTSILLVLLLHRLLLPVVLPLLLVDPSPNLYPSLGTLGTPGTLVKEASELHNTDTY